MRFMPESARPDGFKNFNRVEYKGINLDVLEQIAEKKGLSVITQAVLIEC